MLRRIIVIEFHELTRLFDPFAFRILSACFNKLLKQFHVVHIHPNNIGGKVERDGLVVPSLLEFTFLNRSRVTSTRPARTFPHPLDANNLSNLPALTLPPCWYQMEA